MLESIWLQTRTEGIRRIWDRCRPRGRGGICDHPGVQKLAYTLLQCRRKVDTYFREIGL